MDQPTSWQEGALTHWVYGDAVHALMDWITTGPGNGLAPFKHQAIMCREHYP